MWQIQLLFLSVNKLILNSMEIMTLKQKVGNRIKYLRKLHGHSQDYLAEKLNINKDRISKTERGLIFINDNFLEKLCKFYSLKESYFFTFSQINDSNDRDKLIESINAELTELNIRKLKKVEKMIQIIKS